MRNRVVGSVFLALTLSFVSAQVPLDPERAQAAAFVRPASGAGLACDIRPAQPYLNFDLRYQSGYMIAVPMNASDVPANKLAVLTRVTPLDPPGTPVTLTQLADLPHSTRRGGNEFRLTGGYFIGQGKYLVELGAHDSTGKSCTKKWRIEAHPDKRASALPAALPPGAVAPFTFDTWKHSASPPLASSADHVTVFLHAASFSPKTSRLRTYDQERLLGSLAALRAQLPSARLRVIAFNLDQQKELFRQDDFDEPSWDRLLASLEELQLGTVSYHLLRPQSRSDYLYSLVNQELASSEAPSAILFLGPATQDADKLPLVDFPSRPLRTPLFYLQYSSRWVRNDLADILLRFTRSFSGRAFPIQTPSDFAAALKTVRDQLADGHTGSAAHAGQ